MGEETFLLVTAALANLTFMSPLTVPALQRCNTARTLVRAVRAAAGGSTLFARDQVSVWGGEAVLPQGQLKTL